MLKKLYPSFLLLLSLSTILVYGMPVYVNHGFTDTSVSVYEALFLPHFIFPSIFFFLALMVALVMMAYFTVTLLALLNIRLPKLTAFVESINLRLDWIMPITYTALIIGGLVFDIIYAITKNTGQANPVVSIGVAPILLILFGTIVAGIGFYIPKITADKDE